MDCQIRNATTDDAAAISEVVVSALRESNGQDYPPDIIERVEQSFSPQAILNLLAQRQVYVATVDAHVVATANLDRDIARSVFVAPSYQGAGIGKQLMAMIQWVAANDGFNLLRVPSSITAKGFYGFGSADPRRQRSAARRT